MNKLYNTTLLGLDASTHTKSEAWCEVFIILEMADQPSLIDQLQDVRDPVLRVKKKPSTEP